MSHLECSPPRALDGGAVRNRDDIVLVDRVTRWWPAKAMETKFFTVKDAASDKRTSLRGYSSRENLMLPELVPTEIEKAKAVVMKTDDARVKC